MSISSNVTGCAVVSNSTALVDCCKNSTVYFDSGSYVCATPNILDFQACYHSLNGTNGVSCSSKTSSASKPSKSAIFVLLTLLISILLLPGAEARPHGNSTVKICDGCPPPKIIPCSYPHDWKFVLHGDMTTYDSSAFQVSPPVSCPTGSSGCSVSHGISKTVGWSISGTSGITFGAINIGGSYTYSESTTVGITCSCSPNPGQTECCSWEQEYVKFQVMAQFSPNGGQCDSSGQDTSDKGPFTVTAPITNSDGTASGKCGCFNSGCSDNY